MASISQRHPCLVQGLLQRGYEGVQVRNGGDLLERRCQTCSSIEEDTVLVSSVQHGQSRRRFVAGGLDPHERLDGAGAVHAGVPSVNVSLHDEASGAVPVETPTDVDLLETEPHDKRRAILSHGLPGALPPLRAAGLFEFPWRMASLFPCLRIGTTARSSERPPSARCT